MSGPRHWEDYLKGSSDNPIEGGVFMRLKKPSKLESELALLSTRFLLPDGSVDIEKTNSYRSDVAENLGARIRRDRKIYTRHICYENGIIKVEYLKEKRKNQ